MEQDKIGHDFLESFNVGEFGVQLLKRLVVNGLSDNLAEFHTLKDVESIEEVQKQMDMSGIDCYLETIKGSFFPVQVKTEYATNTFLEVVSQIHLNKNKTKFGWTLDNFTKSYYTYFINYLNGVAVAPSMELRNYFAQSLADRKGLPVINNVRYAFKKAYNYKNDGTEYISIGIPVAWDEFIKWDCISKVWSWDEILEILGDDEDALKIIQAMDTYYETNNMSRIGATGENWCVCENCDTKHEIESS